ncbi:MAG: hypothetical protein WAV22_00035 [Porticoccaceae bacterium]
MIARLRRSYVEMITSGSQLVLLFIALRYPQREIVLTCLGLMALISVFAWQAATRRHRAIDDTPTSRIGSAAQGYVELLGEGRPAPAQPLIDPLRFLPCVWYRYQIETRGENRGWRPYKSGESDAEFLLNDGSGRCLIDPRGAEMLIGRHESWVDGERRYRLWVLLEGAPLYVLGQFVTRQSADLGLATDERLKYLLGEWKQDQKTLLQRFDANRNGIIDFHEWEAARKAAQEEIARAPLPISDDSAVHSLHRPADGRLYLISDLDPRQLARRYRGWSWLHLAVFSGALAGLAYTLGSPG